MSYQNDRMILGIMAAILLPAVKADLETEARGKQEEPPGFDECVAESAAYARDLLIAVDDLEDEDGPDPGESEPVEVVQEPPRVVPRFRRHA